MASIDRTRDGWRARWRTPEGVSRSKNFTREADAERFLTTVEAAKLVGGSGDLRRVRSRLALLPDVRPLDPRGGVEQAAGPSSADPRIAPATRHSTIDSPGVASRSTRRVRPSLRAGHAGQPVSDPRCRRRGRPHPAEPLPVQRRASPGGPAQDDHSVDGRAARSRDEHPRRRRIPRTLRPRLHAARVHPPHAVARRPGKAGRRPCLRPRHDRSSGPPGRGRVTALVRPRVSLSCHEAAPKPQRPWSTHPRVRCRSRG